MWRAMSDLVTQGKVQAVGVSNYGVHHIEEILQVHTIYYYSNINLYTLYIHYIFTYIFLIYII